MKQKYLLFSLHDCAPQHMDRLIKAERLIQEMGVEKATYLWVPNFHHQGVSSENLQFTQWCQKNRDIQIEWFLHGYYHLATEASKSQKNNSKISASWIKEQYLTAGEGEFLHLSAREVNERLNQGIIDFQKTFQKKPSGFVAPAWLYNEHLTHQLTTLQNMFYENHIYTYHTSGKKIFCPSITWATRTPLLLQGSRIVPKLLVRILTQFSVLRIAIHPHDLDHSHAVNSIKSVVETALKTHKAILPSQLIQEV